MGIPRQFDPNDPTGQLSHADRGPVFVGVSWALTAIATVFLCLRLYCKFYVRQRLWWDDWILIAAWVMILADDALTHVLVHEFKLGHHSWDLVVTDPVKFSILLGCRATVTITAIAWTKTAFAVRLLKLTKSHVHRFVWFIIISITVAMGFSAAVPWIQCQPLARGWDSSIQGACWAPGVGTTIWIVTGAYSAAMDFTLAALPWTFLWNLQMRKSERFGVAAAMSMGVIAGIVAIVKTAKLPNLNSPDAYKATELYMWDISESTATMIAACIPSLRVLARDVRNNSNRTHSSGSPFFSKELPRGSSKKSSEKSFEKQSSDNVV